jgi:hypothetical protein
VVIALCPGSEAVLLDRLQVLDPDDEQVNGDVQLIGGCGQVPAVSSQCSAECGKRDQSPGRLRIGPRLLTPGLPRSVGSAVGDLLVVVVDVHQLMSQCDAATDSVEPVVQGDRA